VGSLEVEWPAESFGNVDWLGMYEVLAFGVTNILFYHKGLVLCRLWKKTFCVIYF